VVVSAGPVNWTGWKLKTIPMSSIPTGNGQPRRFSSFMLYQTPGGAQSGTIYFDELSLITGITGVDGLTAEGVPHDWALHQNYPNPFNPSTTIVYDVPVAGRVRLTVWNALGQLVGSLLDEEKGTGRYRESFDASALPSGLYFARLQGGNSVRTLKMMLLR
jgi:hypothetical protein